MEKIVLKGSLQSNSRVTSKRIQEALRDSNLTATELSDLSGVSKNSISQYVNGFHTPSNVSARKMGSFLNVNPLWLMGYDVPAEPIDSILLIFSKLDTSDKNKALGYMQGLLDSGKYNYSEPSAISQ